MIEKRWRSARPFQFVYQVVALVGLDKKSKEHQLAIQHRNEADGRVATDHFYLQIYTFFFLIYIDIYISMVEGPRFYIGESRLSVDSHFPSHNYTLPQFKSKNKSSILDLQIATKVHNQTLVDFYLHVSKNTDQVLSSPFSICMYHKPQYVHNNFQIN